MKSVTKVTDLKIKPKTLKQKRFAELVSSGEVKEFSEAMSLAGYAESSAKAPTFLLSQLTKSEKLASFGLTDELITTSLVEDIKKKPRRRLGELTLAAKLTGLLVDKVQVNHDLGATFELPPDEKDNIVDIL